MVTKMFTLCQLGYRSVHPISHRWDFFPKCWCHCLWPHVLVLTDTLWNWPSARSCRVFGLYLLRFGHRHVKVKAFVAWFSCPFSFILPVKCLEMNCHFTPWPRCPLALLHLLQQPVGPSNVHSRRPDFSLSCVICLNKLNKINFKNRDSKKSCYARLRNKKNS